MFPETGTNNGLLSILAPLMQQKGLDPNLLLMRNNNGFEGEQFMWIIFLFLIFGWGRNGFGNFGNNGQGDLSNLINNDTGRQLLMSAIEGNGTAINQLATTLNCDINSVKSAINGVMSQIQGVGNQVGMSAQQIINAVQAGNCQIASQLAKCCCDNQLAICQQTNTLQNAINNVNVEQERGFSAVAYETQRQTCDIRDSIRAMGEQILEGQRNGEIRDLQDKIDTLREKNSQQAVIINNAQQTAAFGQMISQATSPIVAAVGALQNDVNGIKCKLPETVTVPTNNNVVLPACLAAQYGLGWNGFYGNNSLWG